MIDCGNKSNICISCCNFYITIYLLSFFVCQYLTKYSILFSVNHLNIWPVKWGTNNNSVSCEMTKRNPTAQLLTWMKMWHKWFMSNDKWERMRNRDTTPTHILTHSGFFYNGTKSWSTLVGFWAFVFGRDLLHYKNVIQRLCDKYLVRAPLQCESNKFYTEFFVSTKRTNQ